jgi:hypothetical protein
MGPNGVKGREAPGRCATHVGKASYGDLETALILGHKRRLNIKSLKETTFAAIGAAMTRRSVAPPLGAAIEREIIRWPAQARNKV